MSLWRGYPCTPHHHLVILSRRGEQVPSGEKATAVTSLRVPFRERAPPPGGVPEFYLLVSAGTGKDFAIRRHAMALTQEYGSSIWPECGAGDIPNPDTPVPTSRSQTVGLV